MRSDDLQDLVDAYRTSMQATGMFAGRPTISVARMFFARVGVGGWGELSLTEKCSQSHKNRRVVAWLMVTGRLAASADYLVAVRLNVGDVASRHHDKFFTRFCGVAGELGFAPKAVQLQWSTHPPDDTGADDDSPTCCRPQGAMPREPR